MKFMISQPMAGKTIEQIRAEREGAVRLLEARVMDEALDLLCVVWRFCRGDWR